MFFAMVYRRIKDQPVRLEADYSLTLFQLTGSYQRIAGVGRRQTRVNNAETAVQVHCAQAGWKPGCEMFVLEHPASGRQNPAPFACKGADYAPYMNWEFFPDSLWRFSGTLPFRDSAGLGHYPVDGSKLREAQAVMGVYEPVDHFARKLVSPEIGKQGQRRSRVETGFGKRSFPGSRGKPFV